MYSIVVEGNDGAGKSTFIKLLSKYLRSKGFDVEVFRFNMSYVTESAIDEGRKRK